MRGCWQLQREARVMPQCEGTQRLRHMWGWFLLPNHRSNGIRLLDNAAASKRGACTTHEAATRIAYGATCEQHSPRPLKSHLWCTAGGASQLGSGN